VALSTFRIWRPISANDTELETRCFAPVGESAKVRIRKFGDLFFPSSLAVLDDIAAMEGAHEGSFATGMGFVGLATGMGFVEFAHGREFVKDGADDACEDMDIVPATSNGQGDSKTCFFGFYRRWLGLMSKA
jgi:benzoate/toluate 1,2-dioxygenase subunit alpha